MIRKSFFKWVLLTIVIMVTVGLFSESFPAKKIRLGYLQSDLHQLAAFVALEKGFFKKEGINVIVGGIFRAGLEEMSAFASKDLDFGYVGEAPARKVSNLLFFITLEGIRK